MRRNRLKNIINKSKELSNKQQLVGDSPFEQFKNSLPEELESFKGDNYRLEAAWKAYGSPKNYEEAVWLGLVNPQIPGKMPSIGYNEESDEYEYLNTGKENDIVAKDIRVWDNDVIPLVKELKLGGYVRTFNEEKNCWTYSKNPQKGIEPSENNEQQVIKEFKQGGKTEENDDSISLEEFINQKIQERTEAAIKKATTRKTGYKFKNKDWKNCVATAVDNYGVPVCLRNSDLAANPEKYGFEEIFFGDNTDTLPDGTLLQDYNKPNDATIPGHTIMLVGRTETGAPIYSYSNGDSTPEAMHNSTTNYYFRRWDDKVKPRAYRYIGTPAERAAWEEEYKALYPGTTQAFKQGGQMNVIPEGALHARKNNMELAKEGEVTHKGIPVVDNQGEQQAEIERNEIIFTKETTDKIEGYYKKFKDDSTSTSEKDQLAIKCGKFLVDQILNNTDDKTGLIEEVKQNI